VIIRKLQYYHEGKSAKHLTDIQAMLRQSGGEIDYGFLTRELEQRGLLALLPELPDGPR
jgi:hypothetical protein